MSALPEVTNKQSLVLAAAIIIAGCDSGGSGISTNNGNDVNVSPEVQTLPPQKVPENTEATFDLASLSTSDDSPASEDKASITDDAVAVEVEGEGLIEASLTAGQIRLQINEVDRPGEGVVYLHDEQGNRIARIHVAIGNTSAADLITEVHAWLDNRERLLTLSEANAYFDYESLRAYVTGGVDGDTFSELRETFDAKNRPTAHALSNRIDDLESTLSDYTSAEVSDAALRDATDQAHKALTAHDAILDELFTQLTDAADQYLPEPVGEVAYHSETQSFSRFVGRDSMGVQNDEGWIFDQGREQFALMSDLRSQASCFGGRQ